jgi:sterol desaturase/sphingolipid hydroxylase (fatty acid hydroxylase superfamily)
MQEDYIQLTYSVLILIIGLVMMYTVWFLQNRVLNYHEDSTRQSWIRKQFAARPMFVVWSLPVLFYLGAVISWLGYMGLQNWLRPYNISILSSVFFVIVYVLAAAIMFSKLRECLNQPKQ